MSSVAERAVARGLGASAASPRFRPFPLTRGGQRQTLLGYFLRSRLRWTEPSQDVEVDVQPEVRLLLRASWQPGPRAERPALVLVHGLGGCDASSYTLATGRSAFARGWHVVRMNMRGAGDALSLSLAPYNAGLSGDLVAVLAAVAREVPRVAVAGFSLGANLVLLALGREAAALPQAVFAAAAVSPPLDLSACADALARPANRAYQWHFMNGLRAAYQQRQPLRPDLFPVGAERGLSTIREWDDVITAPLGGYAGVDDYYTRSSAGPWLERIERPCLVLAAQDDPMIPAASVARWPLPASGRVRREMTATGGHVGFVGRTSVPGRFWAAERALAFLEAHLPDKPQRSQRTQRD